MIVDVITSIIAVHHIGDTVLSTLNDTLIKLILLNTTLCEFGKCPWVKDLQCWSFIIIMTANF